MLIIYKVLSMLPQSTKILSAFTIAFNTEGICFLPGIAFVHAAQIMVGHNFGANNVKNAEKSVWICAGFGSSLMALMGLPMILFPDFLLSVFTNDPEVISIGSLYLMLMGASQVFLGFKFILMGGINGAGDTKTPLYIELVEHWGFRIPLVLLFLIIFNHSEKTVWFIMAASLVLSSIATFIIFQTGYWKKLRLLEKRE